jgi:hypothetical protein
MKKLSDIILNAMSSDVFITISPDLMHLRRKELEVSIETVVFLSFDEKKPKVVGVGEELSSSAANRRVDVFQKNSWNQSFPSKKEVLVAFFKHCIRKIHKDTKAIVRPKVIVKGTQSLEDILCGYQQDLLKDVLTESGAREVIFKT